MAGLEVEPAWPISKLGNRSGPFSGVCPNFAFVVVLLGKYTLICHSLLVMGTPLSHLRYRFNSGTLPWTVFSFWLLTKVAAVGVIVARFAREHNRLVEQLARLNSHWDDGQLYNAARKIVIAQMQHITFREYLPLVLGKDALEKHKIQALDQGFYRGMKYLNVLFRDGKNHFSLSARRKHLKPFSFHKWKKFSIKKIKFQSNFKIQDFNISSIWNLPWFFDSKFRFSLIGKFIL